MRIDITEVSKMVPSIYSDYMHLYHQVYGYNCCKVHSQCSIALKTSVQSMLFQQTNDPITLLGFSTIFLPAICINRTFNGVLDDCYCLIDDFFKNIRFQHVDRSHGNSEYMLEWRYLLITRLSNFP